MKFLSDSQVKLLNDRLNDQYGKLEGQPLFRITWSEDQFEKRLTNYTADGLQLLHPEVRELPKYRQWIHNKYILEMLTVVPDGGELVTKLSYEPRWVFEDKNGKPLPPMWGAIYFVIETILGNIQQGDSYTKYKENNESPEEHEMRMKEIELELYGNESDIGDALATGNAVIVPHNYTKEN